MGVDHARLLALVTLPLILVGVLSVDRMPRRPVRASVAHQMTSLVELEQAVAAVQLPAYVERLATAGLSTIDRLHVPRSTVLALTGLDAEQVVRDSHAQLDTALDVLEAGIDQWTPTASTVGSDLHVWRRADDRPTSVGRQSSPAIRTPPMRSSTASNRSSTAQSPAPKWRSR